MLVSALTPPPSVPVLGTTATTNDRVVEDIQAQRGAKHVTQRGPLARESLALLMLETRSQPERLAWLAQFVPSLDGSETPRATRRSSGARRL